VKVLCIHGVGHAEVSSDWQEVAAFDRVNNVEQVVWPSPLAGQADVVVRAFRITQFPQSFALVVRLR
jgi:hypothetical protein